MRKPFDMADKYEPLSYQDEYCDPDSEPTIRTQVPSFLPRIEVDGWEDEPTLPSVRNPLFKEEKRYPGVGLLLVFGTGFLFWGFVAWLAFFR